MSDSDLGDTGGYRERIHGVLEHFPPRERSLENGELRITRAFRGQTLEAAIDYLENLGGTRIGETEVEGDGWRATLQKERVPVGPSYRLTEVTITWSGDEEAVEEVVAGFWLKAFRAPG
ncbi:MAG: hypothetical protein ABEJ58_00210 [Halodesulfurarchaeum sp.]